MTAQSIGEEQRYLFDAFGYLVVRDAASQAQIEELRSSLQVPAGQFDPVHPSRGSQPARVQGRIIYARHRR